MNTWFHWVSDSLFGRSQVITQPLTLDMYQGTKDIHTQVEQHTFVRHLLKDTLESSSYQQYLVDLKLVYSTLENEMYANLKTQPELQKIYFPELNRSSAIEADLNSDSFKSFSKDNSEVAVSYAEHLALLGGKDPILLASHAYVRYLGDLSGGMILKHHVDKKWPDALHFYDFSELFKAYGKSNSMVFKELYKERLNSLIINEQTRQRLIGEAHLAFEFAEKMFDAIQVPEISSIYS